MTFLHPLVGPAVPACLQLSFHLCTLIMHFISLLLFLGALRHLWYFKSPCFSQPAYVEPLCFRLARHYVRLKDTPS